MPIVVRYKRRVPPGKVTPIESFKLFHTYTLAQATELVDKAIEGDGIVHLYTEKEELHELHLKELGAVTVTSESA